MISISYVTKSLHICNILPHKITCNCCSS